MKRETGVNRDREDHLVQMVFVVFQEREDQKGTKGSADLWEQLGLQEEPLESEDQRDPQVQLESQASQEYQVFLGVLGNWGRLEDQEIRAIEEKRVTKEKLVKSD